MEAMLALESGKVFKGLSFGAEGESCGEVVFNTSMAGYQEILTDPSYKGQVVTMTYPLIGNYGVNDEDAESRKIFADGFVVKEYSKVASNWRSKKSLGDYLKESNIQAIEGVDTRELTLHIRSSGAMRCVLSTVDLKEENLVRKAKESPGLIGRDLVKDVTCRKIYRWGEVAHQGSPNHSLRSGSGQAGFRVQGSGKKKLNVVVVDCGVKYNMLRELVKNGCSVIVVPASTTAGEIMELKPDGVLLSNGPGDPAAVGYVVKTVQELIGKLPIFGICLGQQMLGQAFGGKTFKLKFGHHGGNHPVKDLKTGKVHITVQNHGFCVDMDSLNKNEIRMTHINLNDQTLEGIQHKKLPIFSVQFHPESAPGPHDAEYLFGKFVEMMRR